MLYLLVTFPLFAGVPKAIGRLLFCSAYRRES